MSHDATRSAYAAGRFSKWVEGTLYQPWLVQDPTNGEWRGATDAEHAAAFEEAFGPDGSPDWRPLSLRTAGGGVPP